MILKNIGKRLKTFRKSNGYTQEQFSELLNMSLNFYGKIERGQSRLSIEKLVLLHEKFDIDIDYLLTGTPSKNVDYNSVLQKISVWSRNRRQMTDKYILRIDFIPEGCRHIAEEIIYLDLHESLCRRHRKKEDILE